MSFNYLKLYALIGILLLIWRPLGDVLSCLLYVGIIGIDDGRTLMGNVIVIAT